MEIDVSFFSSGYLDVSVHRVPDAWLCIHHTTLEVCSSRFPHSDISGSSDICSSPKLFAAYHVFHRLLVPRHPPCALSSLTSFLGYIALYPAGSCCLQLCCYLFSDVLDQLSLIAFRFSMRFSRYVSAGSDPASGDGEIRTLDPLLARQVLSQLSYTPTDAGLPSFEAIPFPILFSGLFNRWA